MPQLAAVSTGPASAAPEAPTDDFARAWREMRADGDIQFAPVELPEAPPPPDWLLRLLEWLGAVFDPLASGLVSSWPVLKWVLAALALVVIALLLWRTFAPDLFARKKSAADDEALAPEQAAALALLEEADRLAAEGRYDEATHLLLQRSVSQIAAARPDLVDPSSTARELAGAPELPAAARTAFGVIAVRVERSLFALRRLTQDDWQAARAAYAEFALAQRVPAS